MRLRAREIVIPCVSFGARAQLATVEGALTPIEVVALRAIGAGLDDVQAIAQLIGLGQRPFLDLIYDFWLKGYVVIDTSQAKVRLAGEAVNRRGDALEQLETAENNLEVVPLIQELVSGAVLPHIGRPNPVGSASALVPTEQTGFSPATVTRAQLLDAVQSELQRTARHGRKLVAREAWVDAGQLLTEVSANSPFVQQRRYLPIVVDVQRDDDSGQIVFDIVDAPDVPPPIRERIARGLSALARALPNQLFFKRLREELAKGPVTGSITRRAPALERLGKTIGNLAESDPGILAQRHQQLVELHEEAVQEVRAQARRTARINVVSGYEEHNAAIRDLIRGARRQLILGNPWVRLTALLEPPPGIEESWFNLIKDALARGVQVFLLWGIQRDSILDDRVRNAFDDLAARSAGRFVVARGSSTLHAKFAVRDAHHVLVTSYNFLDPPPRERRDSFELGLLVGGTSPDVAPEVALHLLAWTRNSFPDHLASQRILLLPEELDANEVDSPPAPPAPVMPDPAVLQSADVGATPAIRAWAQEWIAAHEKLHGLARQHACGASLVVDREHRAGLWEALRGAERRLAILSDKVSVDAVTDRFVRAICGLVERGTSCALVYRREGASNTEAGPVARLKALAEQHASQLSVEDARNHSKILVADDEVTVGSFNFLSYSGEYESGSGRSERAELSIRAADPNVADTVLASLARQWPKVFEPLIALRETTAGTAAEARVPRTLQPLFREFAASRDRSEVLLRWFEAAQDPWGDLDALRRAEAPPSMLAAAAAAAVARARQLDGPEAIRWRCWLADLRWQELDFIGSALLLPESGRSELGLESWLTQLGADVLAHHPQGVRGGVRPVSPGQAQAAALLLLVAVAEQGRSEYLESLAELRGGLPPPVRTWTHALRVYWLETHQPLPMAQLRLSAGNKQRKEESERAREGFRVALEAAQHVGFVFPLGEHTWERLKLPEHFLGVLKDALEANDPIRAEQYFAAGNTDLERILDNASYEVRDPHNQRIDEPKRSACLKRLRRAMEAARSWIDISAAGGAQENDARLLRACLPLRSALADLATTNVDPLADPPRRLALSRLGPLLGSEEA